MKRILILVALLFCQTIKPIELMLDFVFSYNNKILISEKSVMLGLHESYENRFNDGFYKDKWFNYYHSSDLLRIEGFITEENGFENIIINFTAYIRKTISEEWIKVEELLVIPQFLQSTPSEKYSISNNGYNLVVTFYWRGGFPVTHYHK